MHSRTESDDKEPRTILDPDSIPDKELFKLSLSSLSKELPQTTSSVSTFSIYLRWLEIHREEPSPLTEQWHNTLLHWAQSLRARGFSEDDIVTEVNRWKEEHCPFRSFWRRYPPMPRDIAQAFNNTTTEHLELRERSINTMPKSKKCQRSERTNPPEVDSYRPLQSPGYDADRRDGREKLPTLYYSREREMKKKKMEETLLERPPPHYICNRCNKPGHHLQVCPTNMDPTYDKPPAADYICEVCQKKGVHFKSLCPQNKDPLCIYNKRKVRGIKTPNAKDMKKIPNWWESKFGEKDTAKLLERRDVKYGRLREPSSPTAPPRDENKGVIVKTAAMDKLQKLDNMRTGLLFEESKDMSQVANQSSTNGRKRVLEFSSSDADFGRLSRASSPIAHVLTHRSKRARMLEDKDKPKERETTPEMVYAENGSCPTPKWQFSGQFSSPRGPRAFERVTTTNHDEISLDSYNSDDGMEVDYIPPVMKYSAIVQGLIARHPELGEIINPVKRRTAALDFWPAGNVNKPKTKYIINAITPTRAPIDYADIKTPGGIMYESTPSPGSDLLDRFYDGEEKQDDNDMKGNAEFDVANDFEAIQLKENIIPEVEESSELSSLAGYDMDLTA